LETDSPHPYKNLINNKSKKQTIMKYIYVFPNEKLERNADNETIIRAWKDGEAERYTPEQFAETINDDDFCDLVNWVRVIDDNEGCFEIATLHRDDLERNGYDINLIDDTVMEKLASELGNEYYCQMLNDSIYFVADNLGIPMREDK
jgi:hypothetical protein